MRWECLVIPLLSKPINSWYLSTYNNFYDELSQNPHFVPKLFITPRSQHTWIVVSATYAPDSISDIFFGALYYDQGWILTQTNWLMPHRFNNPSSPSSTNDVIRFDSSKAPLNGLPSWGPNSQFILNVQQSDCDYYPSQPVPVSSLSGISTRNNKYLLKLSMPQLKGCVEYYVKVK